MCPEGKNGLCTPGPVTPFSVEEEMPTKLMPTAKRRTTHSSSQPDERVLFSDEDGDDSPGFYPLNVVATETRIMSLLM